MKIPKSINIMGRKYTVHLVSAETMQRIYGANCVGLCDFYNSKIYVQKNLPPKYRYRVYLHECGHAFTEIVGMDQMLNRNEAELYAQCLSGFIESMLKK